MPTAVASASPQRRCSVSTTSRRAERQPRDTDLLDVQRVGRPPPGSTPPTGGAGPACDRVVVSLVLPPEQESHQPLQHPRPPRRVREPGRLALAAARLGQDRLRDAELAQALGAAVTGADAALLDAAEGQV